MTGKTKTEVKDKLKALRREMDAGIHSSSSYTMALCIEDWLSQGLTRLSPSTVANYRYLAGHAISKLGAVKLRDLTARHVQKALADLSGSLSTRSLRLGHQLIERAIRHAQAADLVGRNVASLVDAPEGRGGRQSRSLTPDQAVAVLEAAEQSPLHAYVVLSLLAGLRTEELRSLPWADVDLDAGTLAVYGSVRASGDTKTPKSRRVLKLPVKAVDALNDQRVQQAAARLKAGSLWQDHGLVFTSAVGTPLDRYNVRRSFRAITKAAGLGEEWTPRELRHTFVSLLSANDVNLEDIARLVGHSGTAVTERVYRHEIRPALTKGAEIMDQLFSNSPACVVRKAPQLLNRVGTDGWELADWKNARDAAMGPATGIRAHGRLLRRHSPDVAGRRRVWPDVAFSCTDSGWTWPGVTQCLPTLAPRLAPRNLVSFANVRADRTQYRPEIGLTTQRDVRIRENARRPAVRRLLRRMAVDLERRSRSGILSGSCRCWWNPPDD